MRKYKWQATALEKVLAMELKVTLGGGGMQGKKQNGDVLYKQLSS